MKSQKRVQAENKKADWPVWPRRSADAKKIRQQSERDKPVKLV